MTGTYGRPEVIIEGSHEPSGPWIEFDFYAKPGPLDRKQRYICELVLEMCFICAVLD